MASQMTPPPSPPQASSSFWQLISGVAHDLDLMLGDLFPDAPLREEYGFTDALDHDSFVNHATLLEQFMRGSGTDPTYFGPEGACSEYRSSKSFFTASETSTSTSEEGRTPSPPPPAPPPRSSPPLSSTNLLDCPPTLAAFNLAETEALGAQMVSSSSISSVQETSEGSSSSPTSSNSFAPCDIGLLERLIRTHPVWFLPAIGRAGATHLLQGKDVGNFVVRQSSKPSTMALSVRLPEGKGPYVEHYLIETVGDAQLRLEGSDNNFHAIPMLVAHYCRCCDELPVQLTLPTALAQASSRQELSSHALLGQDFWLSSMVQSANALPTSDHFTVPSHSTFRPTQEPPPPVAPKHMPQGAPPPPPPRSRQPIESSPESPTTNSGCSRPSESEKTESPKSESESKKIEKKLPKVAHYKQSNVVDLTSVYYKSNLADKISDYEDIWANSAAREADQKNRLSTFQSPSISYIENSRQGNQKFFQRQHSENILIGVRCTFTQGTQTETSPSESPASNSIESNDISSNGEFSSPFYSEPVDSLPIPSGIVPNSLAHDQQNGGDYLSANKDNLTNRLFSHRFSDPNLHWPNNAQCRKPDATLDEERLASLSSSVDNLKFLNPTTQQRRQHGIALSSQWVQELNQRISAYSNKVDNSTQVSSRDLVHKRSPVKAQGNAWPLDSSWEWMGHDNSSSSSDDGTIYPGTLDRKFPCENNTLNELTTVGDLIALRSPDLALPNVAPSSHYDNLDDTYEGEDAATEFCEPWDSMRWERLLRLAIPETPILGDEPPIKENGEQKLSSVYEDTESGDASSVSDMSEALAYQPPRNFEERMEPLLASQRVAAIRNRSTSKIGENIRHYIFRLASEKDNTFSKSIEHFIECTKESPETNPGVVMRNIRQFMSGIKNYLLKHGEGRLDHLLQEERGKLRSDEFLDIDAIIEDSLHKLVIKPLKGYLYQLFVNEYTRNGSLKLLSDNIKFARTKSPEELGVRPELRVPDGDSLETVRHFLDRLQRSYSPLKKLENLLAAISTIYNCVQQDRVSEGTEHASLGAGDFLPIFICVLVQCGLIAAEIEADYMWGLLHSSLMAREGGYYLTTLSSAVHVLKSLQAVSPEAPNFGPPAHNLDIPCKTPSPEPRLACIADLQGFLRIMIPDELTGSIVSRTLPIRPNMTTREVVKLIAHKFNVTNPQDYCLFKLVNGDETMLGENECPQVIKADLLTAGSQCLFTYKRQDAKFIWPIMHEPSSS